MQQLVYYRQISGLDNPPIPEPPTAFPNHLKQHRHSTATSSLARPRTREETVTLRHQSVKADLTEVKFEQQNLKNKRAESTSGDVAIHSPRMQLSTFRTASPPTQSWVSATASRSATDSGTSLPLHRTTMTETEKREWRSLESTHHDCLRKITAAEAALSMPIQPNTNSGSWNNQDGSRDSQKQPKSTH